MGKAKVIKDQIKVPFFSLGGSGSLGALTQMCVSFPPPTLQECPSETSAVRSFVHTGLWARPCPGF